MAFVSFGNPDSRTTLTALETASLTPPSGSPPDGLTLKATIMSFLLVSGPTLPHDPGTRW
ncbi:hypothetical protein GCM10017566_21530 [Amycolatopsis bartoniae]|uniref:Uncharacterized protein n=1 Tax=Amycolatopsis bartoniae TaxID=941986 RepID=A0A8H9MCZ3_9PSEU|nr:hypothetical protein GCM10017566_21530 [Amycolatopsis bartoniae]